MKLLLALGARKGELLGAQWGEFDLDNASPTWRLPANRTKTGEALTIPLVPAVASWLKSLREVAGGSAFVFPKRRRDPRQRVLHVGIDTLNAALAAVEHGLEHFTLHDLRRTMRTHLASLGVRSEVAERCLGHKLRGVEGTYNTHDYLNERRGGTGDLDDAIARHRERHAEDHADQTQGGGLTSPLTSANLQSPLMVPGIALRGPFRIAASRDRLQRSKPASVSNASP